MMFWEATTKNKNDNYEHDDYENGKFFKYFPKISNFYPGIE